MRIKLLYPPKLDDRIVGSNYGKLCRVPLISLPILKSYLQERGFSVDQDDLDVKVHENNKKDLEELRVDLALFNDRDRIIDFLRSGSSAEIEAQGRRILANTDYTDYDVIGFSIINEWNFSSIGSALVLAKLIREETGALIAVGGSDVGGIMDWLDLDDAMRFIDFLCLTPRHFEFMDVLLALRKEGGKIPDVGAMDRREFISSYAQNLPPIIFGNRTKFLEDKISYLSYQMVFYEATARFPSPDFSGLPIDLYRLSFDDLDEEFGLSQSIFILPYYFMMGCPFSCIFCRASAEESNLYIKGVRHIVDDLENPSEEFGTSFFMFLNPEVNPTGKFTRAFLKEMDDRGVRILWSDCATFANLDAGSLEQLYRAGARRLIFGAETASPRMLKYVEKKTTIEQMEKILKRSHELGIWNELEIICGLPHETEDDIRLTRDFLQRNAEYIDWIHLHRFKLLYSKLLLHPERYGITNIRQKPNPKYPGKAFDEIGGLAWEDKDRQIEESWATLNPVVSELVKRGYNSSDESFIRLFALFSRIGDKAEIRKYNLAHPFPPV